MSKIRFLDTPFPDNHNGFDYAPKSVADVQSEEMAQRNVERNHSQQKKLMSLFASIFK